MIETMGWAFAATAVVVVGTVLFAAWRGMDVRVNVLLLSVVMLAVVVFGLAYAAGVDGVNTDILAQLVAALSSDNATADSRIAALTSFLEADRAYNRDLLGVLTICTAAITALSLAIGALLRSGNDLAEPLKKALELLATHKDPRALTGEEFDRAMGAIEAAYGGGAKAEAKGESR